MALEGKGIASQDACIRTTLMSLSIKGMVLFLYANRPSTTERLLSDEEWRFKSNRPGRILTLNDPFENLKFPSS